MKPVQEELKQIRLEKGISLEEISKKTKIRLDFLERIDEGDFSVTPMPYIRAFLREYAEFLGIDPKLVMMKLDNKVETILPQKPGKKAAQKSAPITTVGSETVNKQSEQIEETVVTSEDNVITESETIIDKPEPENDEIQISLFKVPGETEEDVQQLDDNHEDNLTKNTDTQEEEIPLSKENGIEKTDITPPQAEETIENELTAEEPELPEISGKRKPLVIEVPDSTNKIFFVILLSIIFIIALIIVFLNRGSLF